MTQALCIFEFGMMYIPAENVFYEIIITDSLSDKRYEIMNYAISRHVIPVSPNTFYAYLMAIVYGLNDKVNQITGAQFELGGGEEKAIE